MATKQFLTLDGLTRYDELLKGVMSAEDAKAIKSISVSGNTVSFFKTEDGSGTAYATVNMPDISNLMSKISSATGGKIVTSTATGEVSESATAISDLATNAFVGSLPQGAESTTVVDYIGEAIADAADDYMPKGDQWDGNRVAITNYDGTVSEGPSISDPSDDDPTIFTGYIRNTESSGDIVVFAGGADGSATVSITDVNIAELVTRDISMPWSGDLVAMTDSNGTIYEGFPVGAASDGGGIVTGYWVGDPSASGLVVVTTDSGEYDVGATSITYGELADSIAATAGFDDQNTIADFIGSIPQGSSATDVIGYVDEQVDAVEDVADKKTVYIVDNGATSAYAKVYSIYQGSAGSAASPVAGEKLIDINIPKDQVVESGSVADITFHDSKLWDGATDVTALIKGTGTPTAADAGKYIKLILQNVTDPLYIAAQSLVDIYTAQPNATSVQLTISNTNEISAVIVDGAVTTAKIADDAVTAAKVAIAAHTESQTAGTDGIAVSVTTTDGQVSSVSASIAANTYDSYGAASSVETSLIGTSGDAASANTIYGAKAYADAATAEIPTSSIEALFS